MQERAISCTLYKFKVEEAKCYTPVSKSIYSAALKAAIVGAMAVCGAVNPVAGQNKRA